MNHKLSNILLVTLIILFVVKWGWWDYQNEQKVDKLKEELKFIKTDLAYLQNQSLPLDESKEERTEDHLSQAFKRLESKNILDRYQAGLTIQGYGDRGIPTLLECIRSGKKRSRQAALLILSNLQPNSKGMIGVRQILKDYFATGGKNALNIDDRTVAGLLSLAAKVRDRKSQPFIKMGLNHSTSEVRLAAIIGARRLNSVELLPELLARVDKEKPRVQSELIKTIDRMCKKDSVQFSEQLAKLPAKFKFVIINMLKSDKAPEVKAVLRKLMRDQDQRIAITAAHALSIQGDRSARNRIKQFANDKNSGEIKKLADEILKSLPKGH